MINILLRSCCGSLPSFHVTDPVAGGCFFSCSLCGIRTGVYPMTWLAADAWNSFDLLPLQLSLISEDVYYAE